METWIENGKLMTYRHTLRNWERNGKDIKQEHLDSLAQQRQESIDITSLLVQPIEDHFMVLGGNSRNIVDQGLGREKEWITPIDFRQQEDGRFYVFEPVINNEGHIVDWAINREKRSFNTLIAAQKYYSYLHNGQSSAYSFDTVSTDMADPELMEIDWNEIHALAGNIKSFQELHDMIAPTEEELSKASGEGEEAPAMEGDETNETQAQNEQDAVDEQTTDGPVEGESVQKPEYLVNCPDCGAIFDPKKHKARSDAQESISIDEDTLV